MANVEGKVVIVTGGGMGIGFALTQYLAKGGASVVVLEYNAEAKKTAEQKLKDLGLDGSVSILLGDVSKREDVAKLVDFTINKFGRIDGLINNAQAMYPGLSLESENDEQIMLAISSGVLGTIYCMQAVFPYMKKQGYGSIVNVTSGTAINGLGVSVGYGASKGGIMALTRGMAREWGQYGIRVNAYGPVAMTPAAEAYKAKEPEGFKAILTSIALRRLGDPLTDIAPAVSFFISDDSKYVTGQIIMIDGGQIICPV